MKLHLLSTLLLTFAFSAIQAQDCKLLSDSIIGGSEASAYETYYYDNLDRIVKVEEIDSNETQVYNYDTLIYNVDGLLDSVNTIDTWDNSLRNYAKFYYNAENKVSRVETGGDNGNGPWTKASDVFYNAEGLMSDIKLDPFSITGNPEGMMANFENLEWTNGNVTYAELVAQIGGTNDTLEMTLSYDTKKNIEAHFYLSGASDLIFHTNLNNLLFMTFVNDEALGSAGTVAMQYAYTYYPNDEVETRQDYQSVFSENVSLAKYRFDCVASTNILNAEKAKFKVYPNPSQGQYKIAFDKSAAYKLSISNIKGQEVYNTSIKGASVNLDISDLPNGIYVLNITSEHQLQTRKLIKQ